MCSEFDILSTHDAVFCRLRVRIGVSRAFCLCFSYVREKFGSDSEQKRENEEKCDARSRWTKDRRKQTEVPFCFLLKGHAFCFASQFPSLLYSVNSKHDGFICRSTGANEIRTETKKTWILGMAVCGSVRGRQLRSRAHHVRLAHAPRPRRSRLSPESLANFYLSFYTLLHRRGISQGREPGPVVWMVVIFAFPWRQYRCLLGRLTWDVSCDLGTPAM